MTHWLQLRLLCISGPALVLSSSCARVRACVYVWVSTGGCTPVASPCLTSYNKYYPVRRSPCSAEQVAVAQVVRASCRPGPTPAASSTAQQCAPLSTASTHPIQTFGTRDNCSADILVPQRQAMPAYQSQLQCKHRLVTLPMPASSLKLYGGAIASRCNPTTPAAAFCLCCAEARTLSCSPMYIASRALSRQLGTGLHRYALLTKCLRLDPAPAHSLRTHAMPPTTGSRNWCAQCLRSCKIAANVDTKLCQADCPRPTPDLTAAGGAIALAPSVVLHPALAHGLAFTANGRAAA